MGSMETSRLTTTSKSRVRTNPPPHPDVPVAPLELGLRVLRPVVLREPHEPEGPLQLLLTRLVSDVALPAPELYMVLLYNWESPHRCSPRQTEGISDDTRN